eukprot:SAG11_NODE_8328_length_1027_cov_3.547414_1_plen_48_part_10
MTLAHTLADGAGAAEPAFKHQPQAQGKCKFVLCVLRRFVPGSAVRRRR